MDLCYPVGVLSQFLEKTSMTHVQAFKRLLRYLKFTLNYVLHYKKSDENKLIGYSDASWSEDLKRRSSSGYVFFIGQNPVSWKSKKLGMVSSSSTEAEYRALLGCFQESKWLTTLKNEVELTHDKNVLIYCDNQSAIKISKNPVYHSRTKHIDVHYNYVKDMINNNEVTLKYCKTEDMIEDIMTKALDRVKHVKFCEKLKLENSTNEC